MRVLEAALAYHPCFDVDHTGAVAVNAADTICVPADPDGVRAMYGLVAVVIAVHDDALIVSSVAKVNMAPAISTLLPAAIAESAEVANSVRDKAWKPSIDSSRVTLVAICDPAMVIAPLQGSGCR
jgi:hypothetical protein